MVRRDTATRVSQPMIVTQRPPSISQTTQCHVTDNKSSLDLSIKPKNVQITHWFTYAIFEGAKAGPHRTRLESWRYGVIVVSGLALHVALGASKRESIAPSSSCTISRVPWTRGRSARHRLRPMSGSPEHTLRAKRSLCPRRHRCSIRSSVKPPCAQGRRTSFSYPPEHPRGERTRQATAG